MTQKIVLFLGFELKLGGDTFDELLQITCHVLEGR